MKIGRYFLIVTLLILTFFLDRSLSSFFSNLFDYHMVTSSYLLLAILFYAGVIVPQLWFYPMLIGLGIFYDAYYFGYLGLSIWVFPSCFYLFRLKRGQRLGNRFERLFLLLCLIFTFSSATYALAYFYGLTAYPLEQFLTVNLLPSLLLNTIYQILLQPFLDTLLLPPDPFVKS